MRAKLRVGSEPARVDVAVIVALVADLGDQLSFGILGDGDGRVQDADGQLVLSQIIIREARRIFREKFPKRFYDVGIAESAAADVAAGMAKTGLRPIVCIKVLLRRARRNGVRANQARKARSSG